MPDQSRPQKGIDSINWDFLREVLVGLRFPIIYVQWIMECVISPSFYLVLSGSLYGFIKGNKSLRQRNHLSPFLLVLCLKYFSKSLKAVIENSEFNYHPKYENLKISHLIFVDDLMLMSRGDVISIKIIMDCLYSFGAKSGLGANAMKSSLYLARIVGQELEEIQSLANFPKGYIPF